MPALRTRVYIDGYNLYYGCLRKTAFKWLDVLGLFETQILPTILYRAAPEADPATMALHPDCAIKLWAGREFEGRGFGAPFVLDRAARCGEGQAHGHRSWPSSRFRKCKGTPDLTARRPFSNIRCDAYAFSAAILSPNSHRALLSLIS